MRIEQLQSGLPDLAVMGGAIDLDWSAAISAAIFLVLMIVLNKVLFQPYLAIVSKRDAMTEGASGTASALQERARALEAQYAADTAATLTEAAAARDALRAEGKQQETQILTAAREEAAQILATSREQLQGQLKAAEVQMNAQAATLASAIVSRMTKEA